MFFSFISRVVCSALNDTAEAACPRNSIEVCHEHFQNYFSRISNSYSFQRFNEEIFDDNCNLENIHVEYCRILLFVCSECENCMSSFSKRKIICKSCYSTENPSPTCFDCKILISLAKQIEVFKLMLNKLIIKKYTKDMMPNLFEKKTSFNSSALILFILSGISYNCRELKILDEEVSKCAESLDASMKIEIRILKACASYHLNFENFSSEALFFNLLRRKEEYPEEFLYYLALRFNFDFYNKISSKDLIELIKSITVLSSKSRADEYRIFILDVISKINFLSFTIEKEDFYQLIDLFIENADKHNFLLHFLKRREYFDMLFEDRIISILEKIFKINLTESLYPNFRIFEDESFCGTDFEHNYDEDQNNEILFDRSDPANTDENNETQNTQSESSDNNEAQNARSESFESGEELNDHSENSERNNIVENSDSSSSSSDDIIPQSTDTYLLYKDMIGFIFDNFNRFTPNGVIKIACIIFSLLDMGDNEKEDFKDLLGIFYSKINFSNLNLKHILHIIDLHLKHGIFYNYINPTIDNILENIKPGEIDVIFDHVFRSRNKDTLLGIFAKLYDKKRISECRLNKLVEHSIDGFFNGFGMLFQPIKIYGTLSINFQIKYIQKIINQSKNICFFFFDCIDDEIFAHLSQRDIDQLFKYCIEHKNYRPIGRFIEYLNFHQLKQIPDEFIKSITFFKFKTLSNSTRKVFISLGTPFFYFRLPYFIEEMGLSIDEDTFFINSAFESILKNSLFQKCIDFYQNDQKNSDIFENEYMSNIAMDLIIPYNSYSYIGECFYENLNSKQKIYIKANLVYSIIYKIDDIRKNLKIDSQVKSEPNEQEVEDLLKECILISSESKNAMTDFFFDNFNFHTLNIANKLKPLKELEKIISYMDYDYLIETYLRHNCSD